MPRTRKTQSGKPAQPVQSVPGRRYGEGTVSAELQRQMPTPQEARPTRPLTTAAPAVPATSPGSAPVAAAVAPMTPEQRYATQLAAAKQMASRGVPLTRPTANPNEPVTAGLPIGPGVGPNGIRPTSPSPTQRFFQRLADYSGDPFFQELANRVR